MNKLIFKQPITKATYSFLKTIHLLKLGRTFNSIWNIYPSMDFVERNHHA